MGGHLWFVVSLNDLKRNMPKTWKKLWDPFGSCLQNKGQLISKCPSGVFKSPQKPTKYFPGSIVREPKWNPTISGIKRPYFFDLTSF